MDKKAISLIVSAMFAIPLAAWSEDDAAPIAVPKGGSSLQIFGRAYVEYSFGSNRGQLGSAAGAPAGELVSLDLLQAPDNEVGFRGQETLGSGISAWFQCASTMDLRGAGTGAGAAGFCSRNSAIGIKGAFGNAYAGNWDTPLKKTAGAVRIVNSTGIWGASLILFGNSATTNDNAQPTTWSRRQNNSIFYDTPVWNGIQVFTAMSTPSTSVGVTSNQSGGKPRLYSIAANYSNGPILVTAGYEVHQNFKPGQPVNGNYSGTDTGYQLGARYEIGPARIGVIYTKQKLDTGAGTDANVSAWGIGSEWTVSGPHALRAGYHRANSTTGNFVAGPGATLLPQSDNRVFNGGRGDTGGSLWQISYVYAASKRTELTAGYVAVRNNANARYFLSGYSAAPASGQNQSAFAMSIKNTF